MFNCLIVGVGGQGTILASRLIGTAALESGLDVRGSETIGMAQRGGSVASHLRFGRDIDSPLILPGTSDVILAFEPCEAARALPFLKSDGVMITNDAPIQPIGGYDTESVLQHLKNSVNNLYVLDGRHIGEHCGTRCLNVAILGAACVCEILPFSLAFLGKILEEKLDEKFVEMNKRALQVGAEMIKTASGR
jgi:indolepyruvate ferredoxin oxidoreductase beta subunit